MAAASLFPSGMTFHFISATGGHWNLCLCLTEMHMYLQAALAQGFLKKPLTRGTIKYGLVRKLDFPEQPLLAPRVTGQLNPSPLWKELQKS